MEGRVRNIADHSWRAVAVGKQKGIKTCRGHQACLQSEIETRPGDPVIHGQKFSRNAWPSRSDVLVGDGGQAFRRWWLLSILFKS
jgi:hypothetical protein